MVRKFESRNSSLQHVGIGAQDHFKVCGRPSTLVGVNGIVSFVLPVSKNHSSRGRTSPTGIGDLGVNSLIRVGMPGFSKTRLENSFRVWNAGLRGHGEKV